MPMPPPDQRTDMQAWLSAVRARFEGSAPDLLPTFETYAAEAVFGRNFIAADLARLPAGASVLEVGAGAMLLSCQLVREGHEVTSLEPTGSGFGHFERMRAIVMEQAAAHGCLPRILDSTAEALALTDCFDYAFSINVMEHVGNVEQSLKRVAGSLRPGASYRFTCPNYLFPYEPHFNIPTLFSKGLTERVLHRKIHGRPGIADPAGLWESLNWINVSGLRRMAARMQELKMTFDTRLLAATFERIGSDPDFAARRSPLVRNAILWLVRLRLHRVLGWVPAAVQPIIDCRVERLSAPGGR
jgi:SAM-dependent methyltransferase